ncbi:hypothetical protein C2869_09390 [Saccharobesus litoralis]|uniref:Guanylate cyclase domain-containing protein n=1 Tax=Saccharobesus litoralis TaxID=2172099 RepID=A0A2S0VRC1_9ALTE|nr:adenylate/guanylate cyclase domain-containing protein [Saccharobesus litoralis]AWB66630.1 hypothetical protein C2869_09390 [Saccharobesus litoralis]
MFLPLRSKQQLKAIVALFTLVTLAETLVWQLANSFWTQLDHNLIDKYYQQALEDKKAPASSDQIVSVVITDATYRYIESNYLDRHQVALLQNYLYELGAQAVIYDIVFAFPSSPDADEALTEAFDYTANAYLPAGLAYDATSQAKQDYLRPHEIQLLPKLGFKPQFKDQTQAFIASAITTQKPEFANAAGGSGHISSFVDPDGIYRHLASFIKVADYYVPTISLSVFLDAMEIEKDSIQVELGKHIKIPAGDSFLEQDMLVPIDNNGLIYIPFSNQWQNDFPKIEMHKVLELFNDMEAQEQLMEIFAGKYVFVGDISTGISDLGSTTVDHEIPLLALHTAMLNGFLTNTFFTKQDNNLTYLIILSLLILTALFACIKNSAYLYGFYVSSLIGLVYWGYQSFTAFTLIPITTIAISYTLLFAGLVLLTNLLLAKDQRFIKQAFAKYLPQKVVDQLLLSPDSLRLSGEERVVSILFSDLKGFTSISEQMPPAELVELLNEYLTEMTDIVLEEGGIIDKYLGDAIMAEFGVPVSHEQHAEQAVKTALRMQQRLAELREEWRAQGKAELYARVGVNTGKVIVGNMGSSRVFDYTAIGDDVNLASRLEGANKIYDTEIMISESTNRLLPQDKFHTRMLDMIKVKGKTQPVKVFEVLAQAEHQLPQAIQNYHLLYQQAFGAYLSRNFEQAQDFLQQALTNKPNDLAAQSLLSRIEDLKNTDLPADWDGSIQLEQK